MRIWAVCYEIPATLVVDARSGDQAAIQLAIRLMESGAVPATPIRIGVRPASNPDGSGVDVFRVDWIGRAALQATPILGQDRAIWPPGHLEPCWPACPGCAGDREECPIHGQG